MDFVMRVYLHKCKQKGVNFIKLKYKIPEVASSNNMTAAGDMLVDWSGYADDLMLFFDDENSLRLGLKILDETFQRYRLKINPSKTKTMILNHQYKGIDYPISISTLGDKQLENVKIYRYLGCEIEFNKPSTGDTELTLRQDAAESKFYMLAKNLMNMKVNLKIRTHIMNSLVRSRAVYGCQAWCIQQIQMQKLNAAYMSLLRRMTKGGFKSYIHRNEDLLRMAKTDSLHTFVRKQQLKYVTSIIEKDNNSVVKRLLFDDNRSISPQLSLMSSVMKNKNLTINQMCRMLKE